MKAKEDNLQAAVVTYLRLEYKALFCASLGGQYQKYQSQNGDLKKAYDLGGTRYNQTRWLQGLTARGYMAKFCTGFDDAKKTIDNYFNLK